MNLTSVLSEPTLESPDQLIISSLQLRVSQLESLLSTTIPVPLLDPVPKSQNTSATLISSSLPIPPEADKSQSDGSSVDLTLPLYFDNLVSDTIYGACPFDLPYNLLEPPLVAQFEPDQAFFSSLFPCLRRSWSKLVWDDGSIFQVEPFPWTDEEVRHNIILPSRLLASAVLTP
jgi:hypothetical protein